jgi:hypothetical protein
MASVILHQNPNLVKVGGYETLKRSLNPNSKVSFSIPTVNNRLKLTLSKEEEKLIEKHFNYKIDSPEGMNFYSSIDFKMDDKVTAWEISTGDALLKYKAGVAVGLIAESIKDIDNPMCQALYYVYNPDEESNYISETNELRGDIMAELSAAKKESPEKIITLCKYMLNTYEKLTPQRAYNKIIELVDKHTKTNPTLNTIKRQLETPYPEVELTVLIQDCINRSIIVKNNRQHFINRESTTEYGKNIDEIKAFLKQNPDELGEGKPSDKVYSLKRLLKSVA